MPGVEIGHSDLVVEGGLPNRFCSLHSWRLGDVQTIYHIMIAWHFIVHRYGKGAWIDTCGTVRMQGECRIRCRPNGIEIHRVLVYQREIFHQLLVGKRVSGVVALASPSEELVARPHKTVGKEVLLLVIGKVLIGHFAAGLHTIRNVRVEANGIGDGFPDGI